VRDRGADDQERKYLPAAGRCVHKLGAKALAPLWLFGARHEEVQRRVTSQAAHAASTRNISRLYTAATNKVDPRDWLAHTVMVLHGHRVLSPGSLMQIHYPCQGG
jgi:hypothetical protein